jgi:hypothetical protein
MLIIRCILIGLAAWSAIAVPFAVLIGKSIKLGVHE